MARTCIDCQAFDHAAARPEIATLVRCLDERNRERVWNKLVSAAYAPCRHFDPTPGALAEEELCNLMML